MEGLLGQIPIGVILVQVIQARVVVIPLPRDGHSPEDVGHETAHEAGGWIVEVFKHLPFGRESLRIAMVEISSDESKGREVGGDARESLNVGGQFGDRAEVGQDDKLEVTRVAAPAGAKVVKKGNGSAANCGTPLTRTLR